MKIKKHLRKNTAEVCFLLEWRQKKAQQHYCNLEKKCWKYKWYWGLINHILTLRRKEKMRPLSRPNFANVYYILYLLISKTPPLPFLESLSKKKGENYKKTQYYFRRKCCEKKKSIVVRRKNTYSIWVVLMRTYYKKIHIFLEHIVHFVICFA